MIRIDQVYCTHCTYGTSALQRREGPASMETAGWDARAGSLEGDKLRKLYDQLAAYKAYDLPADAARDLADHLQLTAATAPRRLVFLPAPPGKLQTLGMVCHRQRDTSKEQRVRGVYFSHVLAALAGESNGDRWTALDGLELWSAPWVGEDSPTLRHKLDPLGGLKEFFDGKLSPLNDDLLARFVSTSPGEPFRDPQKIIPQRWRERPVEDRIALLQVLLGGFLDRRLTASPQGLLIAAEPSFAAFLFYAIIRLLPDGPLRQIGFSTYEPDPRRINAAHLPLAATTFLHPENSGNWYSLREACQDRAFLYNTFLDLSPNAESNANAYARLVFDIQRRDIAIWPDIDVFMADLQRAKVETFADLDSLANYAREITRLGVSPTPSLALPATRPPAWALFLGQTLVRTLEASSGKEEQIQKLANSKDSLVFLELFSGAGALGHANALIGRLALELLPAILESPRIDNRTKAQAVYNYVKKREHFPTNCPALWKPAQSGRSAISILDLVVESLKISSLERASVEPLNEYESPECLPLFGSLVRASKIDAAKWALVFAGFNRQSNDEYFYGLLAKFAADLPDGEDLKIHENCSPECLKEMGQFGERLKSLLVKIPENDRINFEKRLEILEHCKDKNYFADFAWAARLIDVWRCILESSVNDNLTGDSALHVQKQLEKLPQLLYPDDPAADADKFRRLMIFEAVFEVHPEYLPRPVRRALGLPEIQEIVTHLAPAPVRPQPKRNENLKYVIVALLIVFIGLTGVYLWKENQRRSEEAAMQKVEADKKTKEDLERKKKSQQAEEFLRIQAEQERKKKEADEAEKKAEEERKAKSAAEPIKNNSDSPQKETEQESGRSEETTPTDQHAQPDDANRPSKEAVEAPLPPQRMPLAESARWLEKWTSPLSNDKEKSETEEFVAIRHVKKPSLVNHILSISEQEEIGNLQWGEIDFSTTNNGFEAKINHLPFAKFFLAGNSIRYDLKNKSETHLMALSTCVLEVKGEEESQYYSLHQELHFPPVEMRDGEALIDLSELAKDSPQKQDPIVRKLTAKYRLFLGNGIVTILDDDKSVDNNATASRQDSENKKTDSNYANASNYFKSYPKKAKPCSFSGQKIQSLSQDIPLLAAKLDGDPVVVELFKISNGVWKLKLNRSNSKSIPPGPDGKKITIKDIEKKKSDIQKIFDKQKNINFESKYWKDGFKSLCDIMEQPFVDFPVKPAQTNKEVEYSDKRNEYQRLYIEPLYDKVRKKISACEKEIESLRDFYASDDRFRNLCKKTDSISVVLYRVVDGIRVDTIIIGKPER